MIQTNPLLDTFDTAPFSRINVNHFKPAIEETIRTTRMQIERITSSPAVPSFKNTIEALEFAGLELERVTSIFFNLNSAETTDELQRLAQKISPLLTDLRSDIIQDPLLFARVKEVYEARENLDLNPEEKTLLEKKYKMFTRNGARLSSEEKQLLRELDKKLARLSLDYGEKVLAETNKYELHITDEEDLKGVPHHARQAARLVAKKLNKEGWIFTLHMPSYLPFMKYASNRTLRQELALAFGSRCFHGDENDNQENVLEIVKLRHQKAILLGYPSWADFKLEERMAETPSKVREFLEELLVKARPAALQEYAELENFARETDQIDRLEKWDSAYYGEKLRQSLFDIDDEQLKPYFELNNVLNGVFTVSEKLYGLKFTEVQDIDTYHPDVRTFEVSDEKGANVAIFYADFHPREGKRGGAWMTSFKPQYRLDGSNERPHISIVCNFTPATEEGPSLLSFEEVTTLFHEFGHALHGMLADTTYPSLSGTGVYWDFVELPSQVLENWCYEEEALELFARHYQTGELIPKDFIGKLKDSSTFLEGMATMRQLSFGLLDMSWHATDPSEITDVKAHEELAFEPTRLYPKIAETCMSTSFSHIFQGGYAAGYYSYKWAEVLDADAFELFQEKGIFNREIAMKFRQAILSSGGTEHPMVLYRRFRGKDATPDALLRRAGLLQ